MFTLAFLGLVFITVEKSVQSFTRYLEHPTYTDILVVEQKDAEFPSMTFCPISDGFKAAELKVRLQKLIEL